MAGQKSLQQPNTLAFALHHPAMQIVLAILGLSAISTPIEWYKTNKFNPYMLLALAFILMLALYIARKRAKQDRLPELNESRSFFPFLSHREQDQPFVERMMFERFEEGRALSLFLKENWGKYVFLVGASGIGKSLLVQKYFTFPEDSMPPDPIKEYHDFFGEIHQRLRPFIRESHKEGYERDFSTFVERFEDCLTDQSIGDCEQALRAYSDNLILDRPALLIFEQAERALRLIKDGPNGSDLATTMAKAFLSILRRKKGICLLFVIRSDLSVDAIEALVDYEKSPVLGRVEEFSAIFILSGLETADKKGALNTLRSRFMSIFAAHEQDKARRDFQIFCRALEVAERTRSNTFMIQLVGYLVEHFADTDPRVSQALNDPPNLSRHLIDLYMEKLANEYYVYSSKPGSSPIDARSALYAVLYCLSDENQGTGRALTRDQIVNLTHFPADAVDAAISFVEQKGAIQLTTETAGYRIAHDLLAENVLRSDVINLRSDYKSAYRSYSSREGAEMSVVQAKSQKNIFLDFLNPARQVTTAQVIILVCMVICIFRLFFPREAYKLVGPTNRIVDYVAPGAVDVLSHSYLLYLPILIVHFLWVSFMYRLDRGYFANVTKARSWTRLFSALGAPLGAAFGVLLMFAPSLFVVPVIVGGVFLAVAYVVHPYCDELSDPMRQTSNELGAKITLNMIFSILTTILIYVILRFDVFGESVFATQMVIWISCILFTYYWLAMQYRQGCQEGWSTMLLLFDRSKQVRTALQTDR